MDFIKTSKFLSLILRHKPETIGITLESDGWANVSEILSGMKISMSDLEKIVTEDNKQRYSFNADKSKIKANQGHSTNSVQLKLDLKIPPDVLYHGTARKNFDFIKKDGIRKMNRQYVHLSKDISTAITVGKRHGEPIVLRIDVKKMHENGLNFFLSDNEIWLTDYVDVQYIQVVGEVPEFETLSVKELTDLYPEITKEKISRIFLNGYCTYQTRLTDEILNLIAIYKNNQELVSCLLKLYDKFKKK